MKTEKIPEGFKIEIYPFEVDVEGDKKRAMVNFKASAFGVASVQGVCRQEYPISEIVEKALEKIGRATA